VRNSDEKAAHILKNHNEKNAKMKKSTCLTIFILLTCIYADATAQIFGGSRTVTPSSLPSIPGFNAPAAYSYGTGEGIKIKVNIWGQVPKPGFYEIDYTTNLITLISICGGPNESAKLDEVKIIRYAPQDSSVVEKLVRVNLEKFVAYGEQSNIPPLQNGDTVIIPGGAYSVLQNLVAVIAEVAIIINTILLVNQAIHNGY
jgi:hypothetical protein